MHGGLISYVADNSITFAGGLALGGNALTSEFKINYVAPAVGQSLVGRAVAKGVGKRQAVCQCEVYAIDGERETLCAIAQGTVGFGITSLTNYRLDPRFTCAEPRSRTGLGEALDEDPQLGQAADPFVRLATGRTISIEALARGEKTRLSHR